MSALLETDRLSRRFGGLDAVSDVSVGIEEGTIVGLIGPNGAGKTTLINLVTGFLKPTSGRVMFAGKDVTGERPWNVARAGMSRTFQIAKPFRDMTVRENIALGSMFGPGRSSSVGVSLADADSVLERVGLSNRADTRPGELPIADSKRLELAKALAMKPRLLLLDEVMAGLRHTEIDTSVELIGSLKNDGLTVVVIEHVMKAILAVSDKVIVLHEGRQLAEGSPDEMAADERVIEAYLGERYAKRAREGNGA